MDLLFQNMGKTVRVQFGYFPQPKQEHSISKLRVQDNRDRFKDGDMASCSNYEHRNAENENARTWHGPNECERCLDVDKGQERSLFAGYESKHRNHS